MVVTVTKPMTFTVHWTIGYETIAACDSYNFFFFDTQ